MSLRFDRLSGLNPEHGAFALDLDLALRTDAAVLVPDLAAGARDRHVFVGLDRPDVVVALTDPPIVGLAAWLAARRASSRNMLTKSGSEAHSARIRFNATVFSKPPMPRTRQR